VVADHGFKGLTLDSRISLFLKERFFANTFIFRVIFFTVLSSSHNGWFENVSVYKRTLFEHSL